MHDYKSAAVEAYKRNNALRSRPSKRPGKSALWVEPQPKKPKKSVAMPGRGVAWLP